MTILVVEDDRSVRETLGIVLESYHYAADLVDGAENALAYLRERWPDVMLLDLTLEGMGGEELYAKIREQFGAVPPTIVLSAVQHGETRLAQMPEAKFLAKPYTLEQLIDMIQTTVAEHKAAS